MTQTEERMADRLGGVAAEAAMRSAAEYLLHHDLTAEPSALCACLRSWIKIKLDEALRDAKQALEAHMPGAAEATFLASMRLAGIEAAKEAGFPKETGR